MPTIAEIKMSSDSWKKFEEMNNVAHQIASAHGKHTDEYVKATRLATEWHDEWKAELARATIDDVPENLKSTITTSSGVLYYRRNPGI